MQQNVTFAKANNWWQGLVCATVQGTLSHHSFQNSHFLSSTCGTNSYEETIRNYDGAAVVIPFKGEKTRVFVKIIFPNVCASQDI